PRVFASSDHQAAFKFVDTIRMIFDLHGGIEAWEQETEVRGQRAVQDFEYGALDFKYRAAWATFGSVKFRDAAEMIAGIEQEQAELARRALAGNAPPGPNAGAVGGPPEQISPVPKAITLIVQAQEARRAIPRIKDLATMVGCHRATLSRDPKFRAVREAALRPPVNQPKPAS